MDEMQMIPYTIHESDMARLQKAHDAEMERVTEDKNRLERINKRWFWAWLITFVLLVGGIIFFFWRESQFEVTEKTVTQDVDTGDGDLTLTGIGDIYYGESPADGEDAQKNP